jgi:hypothetical protein
LRVQHASGQLGTATASSAALKTDIRPLNPGRLLDLRPVSYRYKAAYAPLGDTGTQYGLIAEQVARTLPQLVQRDPLGRPTGMHYDQLPVLLLAQLQRQHQRLHFQGGRLARQQNEIDALKRQNQRLAHQQAHIQLLIRRARHH